MNKIIKLLILLIMTFEMASAIPVYSAETESLYEQEKSILVSLNVIDEDGDESDTVTRGEFAVIICRLLRVNDIGGIGEFDDVYDGGEVEKSVKTLSGLGYLNGYENGLFYPDSPILFEQAVKVLVDAAGYSKKAEVNGGYPTGYLITAKDIEITDRAYALTDELITRGHLYHLIVNTLDVPVMETKKDGGKYSYIIDKNVKFMNQWLNVGMVEDIVTANEKTSVAGYPNTKAGEVRIGETCMTAGGVNAQNMLGYKVQAYYDNYRDTEHNILHIAPYRTNSIIINAEDISDKTTADKIEYEIDSQSDKKTKKKDVKNSVVIYNGIIAKNYDDSIFKIKDGTIEVIDANDDEHYEVVKVFEYETRIVDYATTEEIICRYDAPIDIENPDEVNIYIDGEKADVEDIKPWDILSVLRDSNNETADIYVSRKRVYGTPSMKNEEYVTVDESEYEISDYFKKLAGNELPDISVGTEYVFFLDFYGRVAAITKEMSNKGDYFYALLTDVDDTKDAIDDRYIFELLVEKNYGYTREGKIQRYLTSDKLKLNGQKMGDIKLCSELYDPIKKRIKRRLLRVKCNDKDEIVSVQTAKDKCNKYIDGDEANGENPDYVFNYPGRTENEFTLDAVIPKSIAYRADSSTFESFKFATGADTIIFVATNAKNAKDEEYGIYGSSYLKGDTYYPKAYIYDVNDNYESGVIVLMTEVSDDSESSATAPGVDTFNGDDSIMCVEGFGKGINSDEEIVDTVRGVVSGKKFELVTTEDDLKDNGGSWDKSYYGKKLTDLPTGSVIQYKKNSYNEIYRFRVLYIPNSLTTYNEKVSSSGVLSYYTIANFYTAYGVLLKRTENGIIYNAHYDSEYPDGINHAWDRNIKNHYGQGFYVLCETGSNKLKIVSKYELKEGDKIFLPRTNMYGHTMIVIYR